MHCPWCGSPVMIHNHLGNAAGAEILKVSPNKAQITLTLSFVYHVDLPETWNELKRL